MPQTYKPSKEVEYLRYDFTEEEFLIHSRKLARTHQEADRLEEKKVRITADLASRIKSKRSDLQEIARLVANGYEYKNVECEVRWHTPTSGKKMIVRLDTGEIVREEFMSGDEMQDVLPFDEEAQPEMATAE